MKKERLFGKGREYLSGELLEHNVNQDPLLQFMKWLEDAVIAGVPDPSAMALSTAGADGKPSVRMVLLKDATAMGFTFFTNYQSRKGTELSVNPHAALLFYWPLLDRQVRVEGLAEQIDGEASDSFFSSRPVGSRIASFISPQSAVIPGRDYLEERFTKVLDDKKPPERPPHWGGYILKPLTYEFWQGRENRLNDRIQYVQVDDKWEIRRLAP